MKTVAAQGIDFLSGSSPGNEPFDLGHADTLHTAGNDWACAHRRCGHPHHQAPALAFFNTKAKTIAAQEERVGSGETATSISTRPRATSGQCHATVFDIRDPTLFDIRECPAYQLSCCIATLLSTGRILVPNC